MKRTLKILILVFFLNTYTIYSQERQNDATWEETVSFVEDNIRSMRGKIIWTSLSKTETIESNLSYDKTVLTVTNKTISSTTNKEDIRAINLNDLSFAKLEVYETDSYIMLWARERGSVNCKKDFGNSPCNFVELGIADKDMKQRILRAFKHLAYLSNEKYRERRMKSKF